MKNKRNSVVEIEAILWGLVEYKIGMSELSWVGLL